MSYIKQAESVIPTHWGSFRMMIYAKSLDDVKPHFVLLHEEADLGQKLTIRIHSECLTGDLLGSQRCDCGEQLDESMKVVAKRKGALIYLRQEGRGIGLINKLKAYNLQDQGLNTVDANLHLGFEADARHYEIAIGILKDLGVREIDLITNNPDKIRAIDESEIRLVNRISVIIDPQDKNRKYLEVKKDLMGHLL